MINSTDFTNRIEKILSYYNLSAAAFAEEIDFNRSTISHLLSGRNKPSLEFVIKLFQKFPEIDKDWLLFGKGHFPATLQKDTPTSNEKASKVKPSENLDLFSANKSVENLPGATPANKKVDKIVFFYSDGTFNVYEN